jgi:hypothetical protein
VTVLENITVKKTGKNLVFTVDVSVDGRESSTGGSILLCSSGGWKAVPGMPGHKVNLMVNREKTEEEV